MSRVTAIFRTIRDAHAARARLEGAGVDGANIRVIPDHEEGAAHDGDAGARGIEAVGFAPAERDEHVRAVRDGYHVVTADVHAAQLVRAEEVIRQGDHAQSAAHPEDQAIAPGGRPAGAVGATSTIGLADDARQTRGNPLDTRKT